MSYAWGSFVLPLVEDWGWSTAQANLPFTVMIIVFSITMIPAGWLQDKYGPRKVAFVGSILFFVGYSLAALMRYFPFPTWLTMTYGIGVGLACGLTYSTIAPTARKWFSDRPGFAVSLAVMGFGLAAVIFAPLKKTIIGLLGVDGTLFALGIFITVVSLIGSKLIRNPPNEWIPQENTNSNSQLKVKPKVIEELSPSEFIKTTRFYILWLALAAVIGGGLTAIGLLTAYGEIELQLAPAFAALAVSFYSLANGLGRPVMGWMADRWGSIRVMIGVYIIQSSVFIIFPWVATNYLLLFICSLLLGLGYATTFALFPVVVSKISGTKHLGMNYGLVFSAFGLGAITSLVGSWLLDLTGSFTPAFLLAGFATVFGLILLLILYVKFLVR
ncbi:MAG: OFA family MFS transporter [Tissierellales bacterium]|nr:OFA family MFS transporter [Tissierellales bacterium]